MKCAEKYRFQADARIRAFEWSPNGTHIAISILDGEGSVRVLDLKDWNAPPRNAKHAVESKSLTPPQQAPSSLVWHQDEDSLTLAYAFHESPRFYIWNLREGASGPKPVKLPNKSAYSNDYWNWKGIAWSADGNQIAVRCDHEGGGVGIWNKSEILDDSQQAFKPSQYLKVLRPKMLAWAPSSDLAVLHFGNSGQDNQVTMWSADDDKLHNSKVVETTSRVLDMHWQPNGKQLFISGANSVLIERDKDSKSFEGASGFFSRLSPNGRMHVGSSLSESGIIVVKDNELFNRWYFISNPRGQIRLSATPNLLIHGYDRINCVDLATGASKQLGESLGELDWLAAQHQLQCDAHGVCISVGSGKGKIWNASDESLPIQFAKHENVRSLVVNANAKFAAVVLTDQSDDEIANHVLKLRVVSLPSGDHIFEKEIAKRQNFIGGSMMWSKDGNLLALCLENLEVFSLSENKILTSKSIKDIPILAQSSACWLDDISPDSESLLVSCEGIQKAVLLATSSLDLQAQPVAKCVQAAFISNDKLICLRRNGALETVLIENGKTVVKTKPLLGKSFYGSSRLVGAGQVTFSEDRRFIASSTHGGHVRIYDIGKEKLVLTVIPSSATTNEGFVSTISPSGHFRSNSLDTQMKYVVKLQDNSQHIMERIDFNQAFDWANDASKTAVDLSQ